MLNLILAVMKNLMLCLLASFSVILSYSQNNPGIFDADTDVGNVQKHGSVTYDPASQEYTVEGAGTNMWFGHDEFHFVYKKMKGDFIVRTTAAFIGKGVEQHRKWGWMVRTSLDSSSPHINGVVHGDGLTSLQFRRTTGANTEEIKMPITGADVIQLERKGKIYTLSVAKNGDLFTEQKLSDVDLGDDVYVGVFVCSHNPAVIEKAVFRNVRIVVPAPDTLVPYKQYIGSHLEVMDVSTGFSKIIYQSKGSIQAPNWMNDGNRLLYNGDGLLYTFDLKTTTPTLLNTGSAKQNNNDHVMSFDGKMLGISNFDKERKGSIVYTLPITGGEPKQITETAPSYLHGWSPDGKFLIFTGQRNNEFDIYKIPSSGGKEIQLTTAKGLDDGSEYTPDGQFIYFNSARTGTMQIWRMKPDGSSQEQITNDSLNNWFPHISPDGKSIVYITFGRDVSSSDHPFYKHVYLRMMPVSGGPSKVIAYLYGGQGTINTPSWSPDSKKIAFISNTNLLFPIFPTAK